VSGSPTCQALPSLTVAPCSSSSTFLNGACVSNSGITLCNPPVGTPFKGLSHYVQGTISTDVRGFFGGVLGLSKMHINVQACCQAQQQFPHEPLRHHGP
jgi:hypothetical protein